MIEVKDLVKVKEKSNNAGQDKIHNDNGLETKGEVFTKEHFSPSKPEIIEHKMVLSNLLREMKTINFKAEANIPDGGEIKKNHYVIISVDKILQTAELKGWFLSYTNGSVYCYNGAFWKEVNVGTLKTFIGDAAERLGVPKFTVNYHATQLDLLKQFQAKAFFEKPQSNGNGIVINLLNGSFEVTPHSIKLKPFDRNDFLTYQLDFNYDPTASCPLFYRYLNRSLPDKESQNVLAEFIGSVFIKNTTLKLEKVLILWGGGANGKSLFSEIIMALLGRQNVSSYTLQSLTNETGYHRANIGDKLLNYCSELTSDMNEGLFKQLASGEPVEARLPYKEPIIITDYAKLVFNANELPSFKEFSEAVFRRLLLIGFNVTIPEEERDPALANKIISTELPGVFNWVLEGLNRLLQHRKFSTSKSSRELLEEYRRESDTVGLFITDRNYTNAIDEEISLKVLFNDYCSFCKECLYKPLPLRKFSARMRQYKYTMEKKRLGMVVNIKKIS